MQNEKSHNNAALIASAPADLTWLLDRLERAEKVIEMSNMALHMFCNAIALTPSSIPGAIERDLESAYNNARKIAGPEIEQFLSEEA